MAFIMIQNEKDEQRQGSLDDLGDFWNDGILRADLQNVTKAAGKKTAQLQIQ